MANTTSSSLLDGIVSDLQDLGIVTRPHITPPDTGSGGFLPPGGDGVLNQEAPWDNPGGSGGTSDGAIKPPLGSDESGAYGSGKVPPGFIAFGGQYAGYFYNPETHEVGRLTGGPNAKGDAQFSWETLSVKEAKTFLAALTNSENPTFAGGMNINDPSAGTNGSGGSSSLTGGANGSSTDAVGMGNLAARQAELAEQQRQNRIAEVMNAQDAITKRVQAAQQARLEGAKFAVTPSMAQSGYFPGLAPSSPLVRSGLADPFSFRPIGFNPERVANVDDAQLQADLARIRGQAGY